MSMPQCVRDAVWTAMLVTGIALAAPSHSSAQKLDPEIPSVVVDLRGMRINFSPTTAQAGIFGYQAGTLPSKGWGGAVGFHWYPITWKNTTIGLGLEALRAKASSSPTDTAGTATGDKAQAVWTSVAPQVSINFGTGAGWSYLSGGYGISTFMISTDIYPAPDSLPKRATINAGGGARWFINHHVAFTLDLRFYKMSAATTAESSAVAAAASGASINRFVFSVGTSLK
jgi:hypothetical protein